MVAKKEEIGLRRGDLLISVIMASVSAVAIILIFINVKVSLLIAIPVAILFLVGITWLNYNFMSEKDSVSKK